MNFSSFCKAAVENITSKSNARIYKMDPFDVKPTYEQVKCLFKLGYFYNCLDNEITSDLDAFGSSMHIIDIFLNWYYKVRTENPSYKKFSIALKHSIDADILKIQSKRLKEIYGVNIIIGDGRAGVILDELW